MTPEPFEARRFFVRGMAGGFGLATDTQEAVQGVPGETDTGTPSVPDTGASSTDSFSDRLGRALLGTMPQIEDEPEADESPADVEEEGEDEQEAAEDAPETDEADEATEDGEPEQVDERPDYNVIAGQLIQNPRSINQHPAKEHPFILEALVRTYNSALQIADQDAEQRGYERGKQEAEVGAKVATAVAEIDQLRSSDPEGFIAWSEEHPERAEAYFQYKRQGRVAAPPQGQPKQPENDPAVAQIESIGQAKWGELAALPDGARREAEERVRAGLAGSPDLKDWLGRMYRLVDQELAAAEQAKRKKDEEPARKALEQRQEAAAARKAVPRPDVGSGVGAQGGENLEGMSYMDLIALGVKRTVQGARR